MSTEITDELLHLATSAPEEVEAPKDIQFTEWLFTNDKSNIAIRHLNRSLYNAAFNNALGFMHAMNAVTGEVETLIVGVLEDGEVRHIMPMARVLKESEVGNYLSPDGEGGYVGGVSGDGIDGEVDDTAEDTE